MLDTVFFYINLLNFHSNTIITYILLSFLKEKENIYKIDNQQGSTV